MPTKEDLRYYQAMPLDLKIVFSMQRIREWVREFGADGVYISFSGGKDSTVLADLYARFCKEWGCAMWLVFVNTGLEYPEIQKFVKWYAKHLQDKYGVEVHLEILRPKMRFDEVIRKYGYPIISKEVSNTVYYARKNPQSTRGQKLRGELLKQEGSSQFTCEKYEPLLRASFSISDKCCTVMKKQPCFEYEKRTGRKPFIGQLAEESRKRTTAWLQTGCNAFATKRQQSNPMAFWTEQDVLRYIKENRLPIASVYGDVVEVGADGEQYDSNLFGDCGGELKTTLRERTGCVFCGFGCHLEKEPSRFEVLKETHPRQYEYCIGGGEYVDGVWQPSKQGLGMGHVFDELNKIYGDGFIKY